MPPMQLNVVFTFIGTVEVEGPVLTNNSGKTFKSTLDVDFIC